MDANAVAPPAVNPPAVGPPAVGPPAVGPPAGAPPAGPATRLGAGLSRHGLLAAPVLVLAAGAWRGTHGALSAAFALALATVNLIAAARALDWAGRRSTVALAAVAMGGYVGRLAMITIAVLLVKDLAWVDLLALGITLIVAHLGLLVWEVRSTGALTQPVALGKE